MRQRYYQQQIKQQSNRKPRYTDDEWQPLWLWNPCHTKQQRSTTKEKSHSSLRSEEHNLHSFTGVSGGTFHINQIVMIYDQKCTRIRDIDFLQATVLELDHQQQRCLVKFNYNQLNDYARFDEVFQIPFQGLEDDDMDNDKLACLKRIQSMEINPSSIINNNNLKALSEYLDDQKSEDGSELYHHTDSHELYVDPFDSRYDLFLTTEHL
ncbi:unnamed protein product [Didymodactylos carnosus]|uniref:Uncharacterized protein n=1 Tax=Didymodactylos carnosus TaxID=1234261 RepID=A0A814SFP4_9BILA|nr:unnamed protein product [Didymodactylos carnosus]CAF1146829.1 unnamed protein product [Didymodactylos carnosus]CAF3681726.1 unnamed protein product [Didymodactylos carnosus]CAF3910376.1 unnamed protein product [Didymodactylos carnosus]